MLGVVAAVPFETRAQKGPDYTQLRGHYEVAKLRDREEQSWLKGLSPEPRRNMLEFYESRYGQKTVTFEGS